MNRALLFALVSLLPLPVAADAVGPPPDMCPEGSTAVDFCHGPATCRSLGCETDGDCDAGQICADRPLCTREHCCSGRCCAGGCGSEPTTYTHVEGPCGPGNSCTGFDTTCNMVKVCVTPEPGMDAGPPASDAGSVDDSGVTPMDAGEAEDAGEREDAGEGLDSCAEADSGTTPPETDGGCCSVSGPRSALGGALFLALFVVTLGRLHRKG